MGGVATLASGTLESATLSAASSSGSSSAAMVSACAAIVVRRAALRDDSAKRPEEKRSSKAVKFVVAAASTPADAAPFASAPPCIIHALRLTKTVAPASPAAIDAVPTCTNGPSPILNRGMPPHTASPIRSSWNTPNSAKLRLAAKTLSPPKALTGACPSPHPSPHGMKNAAGRERERAQPRDNPPLSLGRRLKRNPRYGLRRGCRINDHGGSWRGAARPGPRCSQVTEMKAPIHEPAAANAT